MPLTTAQAFLIQTRADFDAYSYLRSNPALPDCHWLHYLQMTCEKLAKSYESSGGAGIDEVRKSHVSFSIVAGRMYRDYAGRYLSRTVNDRSREIIDICLLAREVEFLQPVVNSETRPDNCEYPWADSAGAIVCPALYAFDIARRLEDEPAGKAFLKFVEVSIRDLTESLNI